MKKLNWHRICVMVVDDNAFMRELFVSTLRSFGITDTVTEPDCASAIERLKLSRIDPVAAGIGTIDLVLSDYLMAGVDGQLFLRWIRSGRNVPDRFVPFIMVSGAADQVVVEEARDAGVTEFLAKPFSARSLADRILAVVNHARQFVLAPGYFGPDRRRARVAVPRERRISTGADIQTVTPESTVRTLREDVRAVHFLPSNRLRHKLGPNAFPEPVDFDPMIIRAAEERIQALVGDYADWVAKYIRQLRQSLKALRTGQAADRANHGHIARINRIAHELRGQSGTFDYQLITDFGKSLYEATADPGMAVTGDRQKLIAAHVDAIGTVFKNRITGDGGEVGKALLHEIALAVRRYG